MLKIDPQEAKNEGDFISDNFTFLSCSESEISVEVSNSLVGSIGYFFCGF